MKNLIENEYQIDINICFGLQITGSPIHKVPGRSTPPLRSRSGTVTPTSNHAGVGIAPPIMQVKGVDNKLVQIIMDEIVEGGAKVRWSDIAGQDVSNNQEKYHHNESNRFGCVTFDDSYD